MKVIRHTVKKITTLLAAFAGIIILAIGVWSLFQRFADPLEQLARDYNTVHSRVDSSYTVMQSGQQCIYHEITLFSSGDDSIQITVSLPENKATDRLPVLFILGGLEIGRESLTYIDNPGQNVLIGYNYPYSPEYWYENAGIGEIPAIQSAVLEVPAQVSAILKWTEQQPWADTSRINLLGYSFGAIFLPSAQHYAQSNQLSVYAAVMAYGGANLYRLLHSNLKEVPPGLRAGIAWLASSAIYPVEPLLHLSSLEGEFLLINGLSDKKIPPSSWNILQAKTPEPNTIITLDESHMHPDKTALAEKIVDISRDWLLERKAINP